ncbi:MAG: hypothetical protein JSU59_11030 [Nitrospirota bacterium]|nr:MAG: hypothetical protein JSU59_11030 [Nitrospirota bacterium]
MKSVLYLVSKSAQSWPDYQFILNFGQDKVHKTVVLLENRGIFEEELYADHVYELEEGHSDNMNRGKADVHPPSDSISYRKLLDLIFSSDHSVVV